MKKGYTIKEDKDLVSKLDDFFNKEYKPLIDQLCSDLPYEVVQPYESNYGQTLGRKLTFVIHGNIFSRCVIELTENSWMVSPETIMGIDTDFPELLSLLSNSRFAGNPPELYYDESSKDFTLKFSGGCGRGGGSYIDHEGCREMVKKVINMHSKLDKFFILGLTEDNSHALIELMMEVYEAY